MAYRWILTLTALLTAIATAGCSTEPVASSPHSLSARMYHTFSGRTPAVSRRFPRPDSLHTATPIKHLVVLFQENVSFDHYFATYPHALNPPGEPHFRAAPFTPTVNGLSGPLLAHNPNLR